MLTAIGSRRGGGVGLALAALLLTACSPTTPDPAPAVTAPPTATPTETPVEEPAVTGIVSPAIFLAASIC